MQFGSPGWLYALWLVPLLAVLATQAEGTTVISSVECVKKTFPAFVSEMQAVGCDMRTAR